MEKRRPSYDHGTTDVPLLYETIGDCLHRVAGRYPDREVLVSMHQGRRFTYAEFDRLTDLLARGLLRIGVEKGDRVGIWAVNCWEWAAVQFATSKIGAILVNVNPAYRTHELRYALDQSGTSTLVLMHAFKTSRYHEMLLELCPELATSEPGRLQSVALPALRNVVLIGEEVPGAFPFEALLEETGGPTEEDLRSIEARLDPDDDINIQYTSGTTGFPKGVTLTHFNILNNAYHTAMGLRFSAEDRLCVPVPFYHCFGMVLGNLVCVSVGAAIVVPGPIFDPVSVFRAVEQERCTALHGVPTMFITELSHPEFDRYDLSSLRTGIMAGAPCPVKTMEEVIGKMNMEEVVIGYGQTEASPLATMTLSGDSLDRRVSTVGRVMPWQELKIIDPLHGRVLPRGEQGEVCFRGYQVMNRYFNNPEATAEAIDDRGWLHSGDLGTMDEAGYVRITGRIKEMVIRGGENIYPREIEEFLRGHPDVVDVYVFGVPDERYGEELVAWVLPREVVTLSEEAMRAFCEGRIAHFKVPRYWKFLRTSEEFPMTVTGKVQKFKMREIAVRELGLEEGG